jgi:hypothetical protein
MKREELLKVLAKKETEADKNVDDFIPKLFNHIVSIVSSIDTWASMDTKHIPSNVNRALLLKRLSELGYHAKYERGGDQRDGEWEKLVISWQERSGYHDSR